jgi:hypothetical protein
MTPHDLTTWAWEHKEGIVGVIGIVMGWSAHPPRWLVRLRQLPFARAAAVLRWVADHLDWIAGEISPRPTEAPSAPPTGAASTATTTSETTP